MLYQTLDELHGRNRFFYINVVFVAVVMESDRIIFCIVTVNPFCGNDRSSKVTTDIFCYFFGICEGGFGVYVETLVMGAVRLGLDFFKGRSDT